MKIFSKLINYFFVFVIFSVLSSCTQPKKNYLPPKTAEKIKSILVLPFDVCPKDTSKVFFCPVNIVPGQIAPDAQKVMNRLLRTKLKRFSRFYRFTYLSPLEFERIMEVILSKNSNSTQVIKILTKETHTQAVLYGKIYRFKKRVGNAFAVKEPASVAFALVLYDGTTGKILWSGYFDKTQQPLSENLLDIRIYKKIKWLTAEELANNGIDLVLQTFPIKEE